MKKKNVQGAPDGEKETHHYYCDDCGAKFISDEAKCVDCDCGDGTNVAIDEVIIQRPIKNS